MTRLNHTQGGYIALLASMILSIVLTGVAATASSGGYFSRSNVSGSEYKRIALGLSESCVNTALLRIAENFNYQPTVTDRDVAVGAEVCTITSITYSTESAGRKTAYIATQANYQGAWSDMKVSATVTNPSYVANTSGTLIVIVHVVNDGGGTKVASDFTVSVDLGLSPVPGTFAGSEAGTPVVVNAGTITVGVTGPSGYIETQSPECSQPIVIGETKTCVITKDDTPTTATLSVAVNIKNDNGGTKTFADIGQMAIDGTNVLMGQPFTVLPGMHTVSAVALDGYTASGWGEDCTGPVGGLSGSTIVPLTAGQSKTCTIIYDDNPPSGPACADTVMMLDRTGSMSYNPDPPVNSDLEYERTAAKALLDLYSDISPRPQVGVGRFGGVGGPAADIIGALTTDYGTDGSSGGIVGPLFPTGLAAPNQWTSPVSALTNDGAFSRSVINGRQQGFSTFGMTLPAGATVAGIEVTVSGTSTASGGSPTDTLPLVPNAVGNYNSWSPTNTNAAKVAAVGTNDLNTSYIATTTLSTRPGMNAQTFVVPNAGVPAGSIINSVTLFVVASGTPSGANAPTIRLRVENGTGGGQQSDDSNHSLTTSYATIPRIMAVNPLTGLAWTLAEVNAWTTRFGVVRTNSTVGNPRVTQLFVVVNYTPPASPGSIGVELSWNNGASWTASGKTVPLPTIETATTIGGTTDTWGRVWATTEVADGAFLVRIQNNTPTGGTASVNYLTTRVYYSVPPSGLYQAINTGVAGNSSGGTDLQSALSVGNAHLYTAPPKEKVLIILTDGMPTSPNNDQNAVLTVADAVKNSGTKVYTIHFGGASGKNLTAQMANGTTTVPGGSPPHQNGSANDRASATAENDDLDNFFVSPTASDMQSVFEQVGKAVCPAAFAPAPPSPTKGTLVISSYVINNNGGTKVPGDFTVNLSGAGLNPSINNFTGMNTPGRTVTVDPTTGYSVNETAVAGYIISPGSGCAGTINAGDTISCTITADDTTPPPPPPPPPPPSIDIGPWEEATSTSP